MHCRVEDRCSHEMQLGYPSLEQLARHPCIRLWILQVRRSHHLQQHLQGRIPGPALLHTPLPLLPQGRLLPNPPPELPIHVWSYRSHVQRCSPKSLLTKYPKQLIRRQETQASPLHSRVPSTLPLPTLSKGHIPRQEDETF